MKKKVILSSILTIALCLSVIAGSTFALFTSTSEVGIAVTAAKVDMTATISDLKLYSVKANSNGTITDNEFGGKYEYVEREDNFANGGTATFNGATLTLDRITPGDKVSFNVEGANTSNVTIQYRYVIECMRGDELMSGLLVTIGETTYPILSSYTSAWKTLQPDNDIDPVPVVIELPIKAGNEYQNQETKIKVTVEAVQGNADVKGAKPVVEFLDGYTANLDEQTLTDAVVNYDKVGIENGTIALDSVAIENYGKLTMTNMTIAAGTAGTQAYGYAFISGAGSTAVLNDVTVNSANGAVAAVDGAKVTFNSGSVEVNSKSTSGRYLVYAVGAETVVTINDGDFGDFTKTTQNQKRSYIYAGDGATVIINGGIFGKASTRDGYPGIKTDGSAETNVIITGGIFGFDPSAWVATGYQAIKNDSTWYVVPEVVDSVATSAEELSSALENGEDNIVVMNATFTENNLNGRYYKDRNIDFVNCTFKANMNYMYINNATFTNCVFDCGSDNSAVHYDELFGELVFDNCTFISGKIQIGANKEITGTVTFNDCEFAETATTSIWAEKGVRVYSPATFNNCEFNNRVVLAGSNGLAVNFNGCTMEGGKPVYYVDNTDGIIRGGNVPVVTVNQ